MMNTPTPTQLTALADLFSENKKSESFFKGEKIVVEQFGEEWDYEVFTQDPVRFEWHGVHSDEGFESEEAARQAAIKWIDNWEPDEDYYAQ